MLDRYSYGHFAYSGGSSVHLAPDWIGNRRPVVSSFSSQIVSRKGCDLNPIDLRNQSEFVRGLSYVWPDQRDRVELFKEGLCVCFFVDFSFFFFLAAKCLDGSFAVTKESAEVFLERGLRIRFLFSFFHFHFSELSHLASDCPTIVMHSVFLQYPPKETRERVASLIREAGAKATAAAPLFWVRFEWEPVLEKDVKFSERYVLDLITFDGSSEKRRKLAFAHPHGFSIEWLEE